MDAKLVILMLVGIILLAGWWLWRVVVWVWLRPKKMEKLLREQGLAGNPYTLLHGDTKQLCSMSKMANSKPIHLSDDIRPRVLPFYHHIIQTYGKSSFFWRGPVVRINIMEADLIKEILMNNNVFKKPTPNPLAKLLICGLSGYEDEKWSKHIKIVNPAFYMDKLKNMLPAMHLSCSEMIKEWDMLTEGLNKICELDVQPYMEALTSDVISRTSFGSNYQEGRQIFELQSQQAQLTHQVIQSSYIPGWRFLPTKTNKRLKEINNELRFLVRGIINKRLKSMDLRQADDADDDLLGLLMKSSQREIRENGNKNAGLTTEEIIDECKMFYFAGQQSTSNLLTWTMILLSIHPDWQARARDEVFQAFGNNKPDYDGLNHLKTVTMILHEVLRLYPPLTVFTRTIYNETKLGKMTLPPGVQLMLPILLLHHDPELWGDDAKEFKPERFSEGVAKATKNRVSFFPFSWGPRICTGNNFAMLEAKLALAMILQRFSFQLSPTYTHAPSFILVLKPQYGAQLLLRKL